MKFPRGIIDSIDDIVQFKAGGSDQDRNDHNHDVITHQRGTRHEDDANGYKTSSSEVSYF